MKTYTVPPTDAYARSRADRRQVSLMHVFRSAAEAGDARKTGRAKSDDDPEAQDLHSQQRREGVDANALRHHLSIDLNNLMNTIRLDAIVPLSEHPYVEKSVVNYGFKDMSSLTRSHQTDLKIAESIKKSLITHEPRLIPDTIEVTLASGGKDTSQRMSFEITAEMISDPVDIPLDFVAEVDLGAGKMTMQRLRVQT